MKIILVACLVLTLSAVAQKPAIDTSVYSNWERIVDHDISPDGNYLYYQIRQPKSKVLKCILQSIDSKFKINFPTTKPVFFSKDGTFAIFQDTTKGIITLNLISKTETIVPLKTSFEIEESGKDVYLTYKQNQNRIWKNINTNKAIEITNELDHFFDSKNHIVYAKVKGESSNVHSLIKIDLSTYMYDYILKNIPINQVIFDDNSGQLAINTFRVGETNRADSLIVYNTGNGKIESMPLALATNNDLFVYKFKSLFSISKDGMSVFILFDRSKPNHNLQKNNRLLLHSYTDAKIKFERQPSSTSETILFKLDLRSRKYIKLVKETEFINPRNVVDKYVLSQQIDGEYLEEFWNNKSKQKFFLIDASGGQKYSLPLIFPYISPDEKSIIGYDENQRDLLCYNIESKRTVNLTKELTFPVPRFEKLSDTLSKGLRIFCWLNNSTVVFYDKYDIWSAKVDGNTKPKCLTNRIGAAKKIVFRLLNENEGKVLNSPDSLFITAFDSVTKNNGYYFLNLFKGEISLRTMGPFVYDIPDDGLMGGRSFKRAANKNIYLVLRSNCNESPNIYSTQDFVIFNRVTSVFPEKKYNWVKSTLEEITTTDCIKEQALLYTPEDFNPSKQYPAIIYYYEIKSNELNRFVFPGSAFGSDLDIAWFVSHGYIVLIPDIHYTFGEIGASAFKSINAAYEYLKCFPWIDSTKIGLQGHSFGGYETNYIVSHSNKFAAAISSSGPCDFISYYNWKLLDQVSAQFQQEVGQNRMGGTLWDKTEAYLKNSPFLELENVTIPILTVANRGDLNVPYAQGLELYLGLRRLKKKVWMLQYNECTHGVWGRSQIDYILKSAQFFDHYLKSCPAPKWM